MLNNYDQIANQYDRLSRLVFGKSQVIAQVNQLCHIKPASSILIVGGGTGWILEEISKIYGSGLQIVYVEISGKMIALSSARNYKLNVVNFVNLPIEDFKADTTFDVIITPFLFDNFSANRCKLVFSQLNLLLNKHGLWLMVDFTLQAPKRNWWKRAFLKTMYVFFKIIAKVEAQKLTNMDLFFSQAGYLLKEEKLYYAKFIKATIYQKI